MKKVALAAILALSTIGCGTVRNIGDELKEAGIDIVDIAKKEFEKQLPALKETAANVATDLLEKQTAALEKKKLEELNVQLAQIPTTETDDLTGAVTTVTKTWQDFDKDGNGSLDEKELADTGKYIAITLGKLAAKGEMDSGQIQQHATGTGVTIATLLTIMMARKNGRKGLANLLRGGGSATEGVTG